MSDIDYLLRRLDEGYNGAMYITLAAATIRQLQADNAASKNRGDALKLRNEELKTEQEFFKSKEIASYNQALEDAVNAVPSDAGFNFYEGNMDMICRGIEKLKRPTP